ncbi:MAG: TasA family protein [Candidatus Dormibacteraeota bacterium]|nr:TasA family protein [Candidatus Dormibacteraeota bacterium]
MNLFTKRFGLVLAGVVGVGAIAALAIGASFALFNAQAGPVTQTFTAGTVTLSNPAAGACTTNIANMEPGDSGSCAFSVQYGGTLPAYIGVEIASANTVGLINELQFTVNGNPVSASTPTVIGNSTTGTGFTANLGYTLSMAAGNTYQGHSATVNVIFYAVQCSNNGELAQGGVDTGTNENCGDPGPASWHQAPAAASTLSFQNSSGGSAGWTPNSDDASITLSVANSSGAYSVVDFNDVGTSLPTAAPSFTASYYASGTPRWYIQLGPSGTGPYLFGYPEPNGTWVVNGCSGVDSGTGFTYAEAVSEIASNCPTYQNDVTSVNIVADTSAPAPYTTVLTDVQYDGVTYTS